MPRRRGLRPQLLAAVVRSMATLAFRPMSRLVSIVEPSGAIYRMLLVFAARKQSLFSLVWRDQLDFLEPAYAIDQALTSECVSSVSTDAWPGTRLMGHKATVNFYKLSPSATELLTGPGRLFAWRAPQLPEDLAFYVAPDRPWFGSIAHEGDAFLYADAIDVAEVFANVPGLELATG